MVLSFTFLELGQSCMSSESAWLTPVVLRSAMIEQASAAIPEGHRHPHPTAAQPP